MASQFTFLLSPRPHIPGLGRRQLQLSSNIFMQFMQLSPLLNSSSQSQWSGAEYFKRDQSDCIQKTNPDLEDEMNENVESPGPSHNPACFDTNSNICNDPENQASNKQETKYPTQVIDRDADGHESLVQYNFNKNTLRMFDIFQSLNISSKTEIYKQKEDRACVDPSIFYCKNLFLKDRKGQYFIVICHEDTNMDLKYLRKAVKAYRNFNFVTSEEMKVLLGTDPGGVTPLALMFTNALDISMVISRTLYKERASLMFHPLDSRLAIKISLPSLLRFLKYVGHSVTIVD